MEMRRVANYTQYSTTQHNITNLCSKGTWISSPGPSSPRRRRSRCPPAPPSASSPSPWRSSHASPHGCDGEAKAMPCRRLQGYHRVEADDFSRRSIDPCGPLGCLLPCTLSAAPFLPPMGVERGRGTAPRSPAPPPGCRGRRDDRARSGLEDRLPGGRGGEVTARRRWGGRERRGEGEGEAAAGEGVGFGGGEANRSAG